MRYIVSNVLNPRVRARFTRSKRRQVLRYLRRFLMRQNASTRAPEIYFCTPPMYSFETWIYVCRAKAEEALEMATAALQPINGWSVETPSSKIGKHRDTRGRGLSGVYTREFSDTVHTSILSNGIVCNRYVYPRIAVPFSSPIHRWENLFFDTLHAVEDTKGQAVATYDAQMQAVIAGVKPVGVFVPFCPPLRYVKCLKDAGLAFKVEDTDSGGWKRISFCQRELIGDLFDLNALSDSYTLMGCGSVLRQARDEGKSLEDLRDRPISDFLIGWDYARQHPKNAFDRIVTDLLLGYPVESTVGGILGTR